MSDGHAELGLPSPEDTTPGPHVNPNVDRSEPADAPGGTGAAPALSPGTSLLSGSPGLTGVGDPGHAGAPASVPESVAPATVPASESPEHHANVSVRQLLRNTTFGYGGLFLAIVGGAVTTPVLLHHLGAGDFGFLSAVQVVTVFVGIVEAGVATATVQRVAALLAVDDKDRLQSLLATAKALYWLTTIVSAVVFGIITFFIRSLLNLGPLSLGKAQETFVLVALGAVLGFMGTIGQATIYASGRADRAGVPSLAVGLLTRAATVVVALEGGGLIGVAAVMALSSGATTIINRVIGRRIVPQLAAPLRRATKHYAKDLFSFGMRYVWLQIGGTFSYGIDQIVIGVMLPVAQVAPYNIAGSASGALLSISTTGTSMLAPRFTHRNALGESDAAFREYSAGLFAGLALAAPSTIALIFFAPRLLNLWLHNPPQHTYEICIGLTIFTVLIIPGMLSSTLLVSVNRTRLIARIAIPIALVNLGLSVLATRRYGPIGPVIGSIPQGLIFESTVLPILVCATLRVPKKRLVTSVLVPVIVMCLGAAAVAAAIALVLPQPAWWGVPACVVTVLASWVMVIPIARHAQPAMARHLTKILLRR